MLDRDQISRLLEAALPRYRIFLVTAFYTGMRLSELLGLTWNNIRAFGRVLDAEKRG